MKKLFSFLCLLMLGAGMSAWAFTPSWTNSELAANQFLGALSGSVDIFVMNYARNGNTRPALRLEFILNKNSGTQMYGSIKGPKAGTYSVYNGTSISSNAGKWLGYATNSYYTRYTSSAGNTYTLQSGTITVAEGVGGPYITGYITTSDGNTVVDFVIGTPAPASGEDGTIQVIPGANGEIKVGSGSWQSTTFSQGYTGGTYVTISAQGTGDYVFDQWLEDGNTDATRTITVDGDATYTATFKKLIIHHTFYWANLAEGGTDAEYGSGDGLYVYRLYFTDGGINYPSLDLQLLYDKSKLKDYGSITAPPEGVYNMLNSVYDDFVEFYALGGTENSSYMSRYWDANDSYKPFRTGTITISQGANGYPYIEVITGQGNGTKQFFEITVGEPAAAVVTHNVSITAPTNGTITVSYNDGSAQSFTSGSRDIAEGTTLTVTTNPAADYHFSAWTDNGAASVTVDGPKTIGATFAENDYFLNATYGEGGASVTRDDGGTNTTVKRAGNTVTLTPNAAAGYEFVEWTGDGATYMSGNVFTFPTNGTHNTTYNIQATFQLRSFTITFLDEDGSTLQSDVLNYGAAITYRGSTPTKAPDEDNLYTFAGWDVDNNGTADFAPTDNLGTVTGTTTFKAVFNGTSKDLYLKDGASTGQKDIDFDEFADLYNGETMSSVILTRTFTAGNWYTLCLPFNANSTQLQGSGLKGQVFTFQYANGSADLEGEGLYLHFGTANEIVAGRGYLVRFNSTPKTNEFPFYSVIINTTADQTSLESLIANNAYKTQGTISIVGSLRLITLPQDDDNRYMAIKDNKIWYPGNNTRVPAYRAFFYDSNPSGIQQRVHIVVDGVDMGEMLIDNGELLDAGGDDRAPRKYFRNGNLYIEREGVIYDAQGKRM